MINTTSFWGNSTLSLSTKSISAYIKVKLDSLTSSSFTFTKLISFHLLEPDEISIVIAKLAFVNH